MSGDFSDETYLVRRLAEGNREAFEHLYHKHNAALIRVCAGIVGSHATAEEVAQETWVSVLNHIGDFAGRSSLAGWIFTILVNKARTRARRDGRMVSFDDDSTGDGLTDAFDGRGRWKTLPELWDELTPERIIAGRSVLDHVNAAIEALSATQKAVLILYTQQGLPTAEICSVLDISESNLRVTLHRARLAVRAALDQANMD